MSEELVRKAYDKVAQEYDKYRGEFDNREQLEEFCNRLSRGSKVLDLGCGAGMPIDSFLVDKGFSVTGVDISSSMISLARKNVPSAEFIYRNMVDVDFPENSFDGVIAAYSIIHVPKEKEDILFDKIRLWLKDKGLLLMSLALDEGEYVHDFLGTEMYWSHRGPEYYVNLEGFEIVYDKVVEKGNEKHRWVMLRKDS